MSSIFEQAFSKIVVKLCTDICDGDTAPNGQTFTDLERAGQYLQKIGNDEGGSYDFLQNFILDLDKQFDNNQSRTEKGHPFFPAALCRQFWDKSIGYAHECQTDTIGYFTVHAEGGMRFAKAAKAKLLEALEEKEKADRMSYID